MQYPLKPLRKTSTTHIHPPYTHTPTYKQKQKKTKRSPAINSIVNYINCMLLALVFPVCVDKSIPLRGKTFFLSAAVRQDSLGSWLFHVCVYLCQGQSTTQLPICAQSCTEGWSDVCMVSIVQVSGRDCWYMQCDYWKEIKVPEVSMQILSPCSLMCLQDVVRTMQLSVAVSTCCVLW